MEREGGRVRLQHIKDVISLLVYHASPSNLAFIKEKVHNHINEMKEMLLDCENCKTPSGGSCSSCVAIQEMIGWALEKLREAVKQCS